MTLIHGKVCLMADFDGRAVGTVCIKIMDDYEHVDNDMLSILRYMYGGFKIWRFQI